LPSARAAALCRRVRVFVLSVISRRLAVVDEFLISGQMAALLSPSAPPPCANLPSWVAAARARRPGLGARLLRPCGGCPKTRHTFC
jgi:hypothetical protein